MLRRERARAPGTPPFASPPRRGVSVGSLYRYFSNEQAIQYRLQVDEWQKTGAALHTLSTDTSRCAR